MTPNTNHDHDINVYADWLIDNNHENLADETRTEPIQDHWMYEFRHTTQCVGTLYHNRVGDQHPPVGNIIDYSLPTGDLVGSEASNRITRR